MDASHDIASNLLLCSNVVVRHNPRRPYRYAGPSPNSSTVSALDGRIRRPAPVAPHSNSLPRQGIRQPGSCACPMVRQYRAFPFLDHHGNQSRTQRPDPAFRRDTVDCTAKARHRGRLVQRHSHWRRGCSRARLSHRPHGRPLRGRPDLRSRTRARLLDRYRTPRKGRELPEGLAPALLKRVNVKRVVGHHASGSMIAVIVIRASASFLNADTCPRPPSPAAHVPTRANQRQIAST